MSCPGLSRVSITTAVPDLHLSWLWITGTRPVMTEMGRESEFDHVFL